MALKRMDNIGIVVEDLGGAIDFYRELGLELEKAGPRSKENGPDVSLGLGDQRVEIAMMRTPDGHEAARALPLPHAARRRGSPQRPRERFRLPPRHVCRGRHRRDRLKGSGKRGAQLVEVEVVQYKKTSGSPLLHPRAWSGLLIGLAQELS